MISCIQRTVAKFAMHDIQTRSDDMLEFDWLEFMLNTSSGPQDRLDKIIRRIANQHDAAVEKLGYDLGDVNKLRQWLDVLVAQRNRATPRYKNLR